MVSWSEALEVRRRIIGETERWFVLIPLRERLKPLSQLEGRERETLVCINKTTMRHQRGEWKSLQCFPKTREGRSRFQEV